MKTTTLHSVVITSGLLAIALLSWAFQAQDVLLQTLLFVTSIIFLLAGMLGYYLAFYTDRIVSIEPCVAYMDEGETGPKAVLFDSAGDEYLLRRSDPRLAGRRESYHRLEPTLRTSGQARYQLPIPETDQSVDYSIIWNGTAADLLDMHRIASNDASVVNPKVGPSFLLKAPDAWFRSWLNEMELHLRNEICLEHRLNKQMTRQQAAKQLRGAFARYEPHGLRVDVLG